MKKYFSLLIFLVIFFTGCGKEQLLVQTYTSPAKADKVKEMITKDDKSDAYLIVDLVDDYKFIANNQKDGKLIAKLLVANIKTLINQTNFISLSSVKNDLDIPLSIDFKIINYKYNVKNNRIKAELSVEFNIRKESNLLYTQVYSKKVNKYSSAGVQALPSKNQILSKMSKIIAKKFIKDISPLKTQKLLVIKKLPKELKTSIEFAQAGDFKSAIKLMRSYKGDKDYKYYYDLAIFYEGLAAKLNDVTYLTQADKYYNLAIKNGGNDDSDVLFAKKEFDRFYNIIKSIAKQKANNLKRLQEGEYELLD